MLNLASMLRKARYSIGCAAGGLSRGSYRRLSAAVKRAATFSALVTYDLWVLLAFHHRRHRRDSLVLRTDGIGDCVLWLDAAKELRRIKVLEGRIVLLVSAPADELMSHCSIFDEVWSFDRKRMLQDRDYRRDLLRKVRSRGFHVALNAVASRHPLVDDALVRAAAAPISIGIRGDFANASPRQQRITNLWYTDLYPAPPVMMELRRAQEFMARLGAGYAPGSPALPFRPPRRTDLRAGPYYILFPGAGWAGKAWPAENFRALARRIFSRTGLHGLVCGGPSEKALTAAVVAGVEDCVTDIGGKTSLEELAGVIHAASFLVSNDTSAIHIAAALDVPSVAILGGGHPGRFLPYDSDRGGRADPIVVTTPMPCFGCAWECIFHRASDAPYPCISAVAVTRVWAAVESIIADVRSPSSLPHRAREPAIADPMP